MGTAATKRNEEAGADNSSAEGEGSASKGVTDGASACHSFWEVGAGAGVKGAEGCAGFVQQAGVAQPFMSQPEQQQEDLAGGAAPRVGTANAPCATSARPSSRLQPNFTRRDAIFAC